MLTIYLACLIFGAILLAFSLFTGTNDSESSHIDASDHNIDNVISNSDAHLLSSSLDTHNTIQSEIFHSDATHLQHHIEHYHTDEKDSIKFLSFRNIIYFATFFGLTGTIFSLIELSSILTFILSVLVGSISYYFGYKLMKYLKETESGKPINLNELTGKFAKVTLPVSKDKKGKILVFLEDQIVELTAVVSEASEKDNFQVGEKVIIVEVVNNIAYVDTDNIN